MAAVSGCGGNSSGGSISGTIGGETFPVEDVISAQVLAHDNKGNTAMVGAIMLGNIRDLCNEIGAHNMAPNFRGLFMNPFIVSAAIEPPTVGAYTVAGDSGNVVTSNTLATDSTCTGLPALTVNGSGGTVTLTSVSGDVLAGHFDMMMANGDHITGSFTPEACPGFQTLFDATGPATCQ